MNKFLGIELGSTRIKAVLIDENARVLAQGGYEWENSLVDGLWSYSLEEVECGLQSSFAALSHDYREKFGEPLCEVSALGISAMMHGYLAFDKEDRLSAPFRTWRNTNAEAAANELSALFKFNLPMRWSIAQYYQSIMDSEPHVKDVAFLTTLAGYVHYRLTGRKVLGIGDASGMFPISGKTYDGGMLYKFNSLIKEKGIDTRAEDILPTVLNVGEDAGVLTEAGG